MASIKVYIRRFSLIIILALLIVVAWKRTAVADWFKLRSYNPTAEISQLALEDTMTPYATHIYYINHPALDSTEQQFAKDCTIQEQTIVLGCYQSSERGIYIRTVTDNRLKGVEEVTAAHEMLHGAYERLSDKEKNYVNGLLLNYYNHEMHDQRLIDTINSYKKTEPNDLIDEMHSIFGTEVVTLPPALETYYSRYFTSRSAVTSFAAGYQAEFTSRLDKIKIYEVQLNELKAQVDKEESNLSTTSSQLEADRANLDRMRGSGQIAQYNAGVSSFNREVADYNDGVRQLKLDINSYNSIVERHNQLAEEVHGLYSSLGTNLNQQLAQ